MTILFFFFLKTLACTICSLHEASSTIQLMSDQNSLVYSDFSSTCSTTDLFIKTGGGGVIFYQYADSTAKKFV